MKSRYVNDDIIEEKERCAAEIIKKALSRKDRLFVIYGGDAAGLVLLHMLRAVCGAGRIPTPVISLQFLPMPGEKLRFIEKLRRMWSLDLRVARFPEKLDGGRYSGEEMFTEAGKVLAGLSAKSVLSSATTFFSGGAFCSEEQGRTEFRPLAGFSDEDVNIYSERRRLPACSAGRGPAGMEEAAGAAGRAPDLEDKELSDRLKKLGYI